jgi:hypothetical protein
MLFSLVPTNYADFKIDRRPPKRQRPRIRK